MQIMCYTIAVVKQRRRKIMALNSQQERIIGFLAQGLKPAQVASIVGCTPAYISQLLGEEGPEGFKEELQGKVKELVASGDIEETTVSSKYLSMEHRLLQTIQDRLGEAEFPALVNALKVVGERQEKRALRKAGLLHPQGSHITQNIVQISVPAHTLPEFKLNNNLEVTSIGNRVMAPMSSQAVRALFAAKKPAVDNAQHQNVIEHEKPSLSTEF